MVEIRDAVLADLGALVEIGNALLASTTYTWTERPETVDERAEWFTARTVAGHPVLVAVATDAAGTGEVVGWASYGYFRDVTRTPGYRYTVEHSVHVREERWGRGVGRALLEALVERAVHAGVRVMIAAIDGTNHDSMRFHERLGFVETARMPGIGDKWGRPCDLILMQRDLRRPVDQSADGTSTQ